MRIKWGNICRRYGMVVSTQICLLSLLPPLPPLPPWPPSPPCHHHGGPLYVWTCAFSASPSGWGLAGGSGAGCGGPPQTPCWMYLQGRKADGVHMWPLQSGCGHFRPSLCVSSVAPSPRSYGAFAVIVPAGGEGGVDGATEGFPWVPVKLNTFHRVLVTQILFCTSPLSFFPLAVFPSLSGHPPPPADLSDSLYSEYMLIVRNMWEHLLLLCGCRCTLSSLFGWTEVLNFYMVHLIIFFFYGPCFLCLILCALSLWEIWCYLNLSLPFCPYFWEQTHMN